MNAKEAQFLAQLARVNRATAEINSGAYKLSKLQRGVEGSSGYDSNGEWVGIQWRDLTDEEKLQDKVNELNQHIHALQEMADDFYQD